MNGALKFLDKDRGGETPHPSSEIEEKSCPQEKKCSLTY